MFGRHRASRFEKQALELGGHVRKGEAGELVVYANSITRTETDAKGEETEREIPFMKGYTVFNAAQCDGLPAHYTAKAEPPGHTTVLTDTFDGEEAEDEEPGPAVVEPPTDEKKILIRWRSSRGRRASDL
jgi:N-terminal domain of anti-restriction factor ArdC